MSKVDGLTLDPARVANTERQTVAIPGVAQWGGEWTPGVAKSFKELGVTKTEALALVKDHGLKLVEAKADAPPDDFDPFGTIPDDPDASETGEVEAPLNPPEPEQEPTG